MRYAVGIDVGSQACSFCVLTPDKSVVLKPPTMAHAAAGFALLHAKLASLEVPPEQVLVGLEATSRYGENRSEVLRHQGYQVCFLHPAQTHQVARARVGCAPKLTSWMPVRWRMSCSAPKRAPAMSRAT